MDCSVVVFLVVKLLYENMDIGYTMSLGVVTSLWSIVLINTFFFCPKYKATIDREPEDMIKDYNDNSNVTSIANQNRKNPVYTGDYKLC